MSRSLTLLFAVLIAGLICVTPLVYWKHRTRQVRNFRVVHAGVLYRSGQLPLPIFQEMARNYGIKTVITLRYVAQAGQRPPDWEEEEYCRAHGIRHVRLPARGWWSPDGTVPADENVQKFLTIMDDPAHHPVLVHCFAGKHRTGAMCAVYRMEYQGWSNADALREMQACGYENLEGEWDVKAYLEYYLPRPLRRVAGSPLTPSPSAW
ncbi:MAG: dual specificity protein phosphatase family protein [Gemmataceae bacterium]